MKKALLEQAIGILRHMTMASGSSTTDLTISFIFVVFDKFYFCCKCLRLMIYGMIQK